MHTWQSNSKFLCLQTFRLNQSMIFDFFDRFNKSTVTDGIANVLNDNLDAFIYDGTVLDYLVAQDEDCRLLTVGSWYAMTGELKTFHRVISSRF